MEKKTSESQLRAIKAYREKNKEKTKIDKSKWHARYFVSNYATPSDITELKLLGPMGAYDFQKFKKMNFSHDYDDLLAELKADIKEGLVHDNLLVERELVGGAKSYASIIDYYYNLDDVPKDVNIFLENVDEVLKEMEEMSKLL